MLLHSKENLFYAKDLPLLQMRWQNFNMSNEGTIWVLSTKLIGVYDLVVISSSNVVLTFKRVALLAEDECEVWKHVKTCSRQIWMDVSVHCKSHCARGSAPTPQRRCWVRPAASSPPPRRWLEQPSCRTAGCWTPDSEKTRWIKAKVQRRAKLKESNWWANGNDNLVR